MRIKRLGAVLLAASMVLLTACGGGAKNGGDQNNDKTSNGKVKLVFYDWTDEQAYLDPAVEAYNAQSKVAEVEVVYFPATDYAEKILSSFSSNTEFDILGVNGVSYYGDYKSKKCLQDISSYVKDSGLDTSVYGNVFEQSNQDGIFGLPYRQSVWLLFVNQELFQKSGIEVPTKQLTWTEYRELAKQLTKDDTYGGLVGMDNFVYMQQMGGSVMDKDTTIIRRSLELWKSLEEDQSHVPFAEKLELGQNAGSLFTTAPATKVAMFQNGTWGVASYNSKYESGEMPFKYAVMPMPIPEGGKEYSAPSGMNFLSISKTSKHPAEAYDFIQFMCTYEGASRIAEKGTLTAYSDDKVKEIYLNAVKQDTDTLAKIVFSENNVIEQIYDENYSAVETILKEEMELYMIGEQDLDTTMKNFEERRAEYMK